jgi:aflatoxin B1 aldehyde reductase
MDRGVTSGRDDDNAETIQKRLKTFHEETKPIADHFDTRKELVRLDGDRPRDDVYADLCSQLKGRLGSNLPPQDDYILAAPRNRIPPRVILGTMNMGGAGVSEVTARELVREFSTSEPGCDEIDTARLYSDGETEKILGRILINDKTRIASKVNPFAGRGGSLSPNSIASQLGETLAALKTDSIDVLYLHAPDPTTPIEQTLEACDALHRKGKFRELGLSNFPAWQVVNAYHISASRGWVRPTVYQGMYNVFARGIETELLPALRTLGIRLYASNPLAGGLLSAPLGQVSGSLKEGRFSKLKPPFLDALMLVANSCKAYDIPIHEAALRWLAHHSLLRTTRDDGIIIGASRVAHVKENIQSVRRAGPLPLPLVVALDKAWDLCKIDAPLYFSS